MVYVRRRKLENMLFVRKQISTSIILLAGERDGRLDPLQGGGVVGPGAGGGCAGAGVEGTQVEGGQVGGLGEGDGVGDGGSVLGGEVGGRGAHEGGEGLAGVLQGALHGGKWVRGAETGHAW